MSQARLSLAALLLSRVCLTPARRLGLRDIACLWTWLAESSGPWAGDITAHKKHACAEVTQEFGSILGSLGRNLFRFTALCLCGMGRS